MKKDDFLDADKRRFYGLTLGKLVCVPGLLGLLWAALII